MEQTLVFRRLGRRQQALQAHPVFDRLQTPADLQLFMSWHVFAVWDFMSLVKRLQRDLTTVTLPWVPARSAQAARLINDIVLGEETDEAPGGRFLSHYELYLESMREVGADTTVISDVVDQVAGGLTVEQALANAEVHPAVQRFVNHTMATVQQGSTVEALGSFFFGREDVIPKMFSRLLQRWQLDASQAPMFVYYLQRHIELDGDQHGPAALALLQSFTEGDTDALASLEAAAEEAIAERQLFWDALAEEMASEGQAMRIDRAG